MKKKRITLWLVVLCLLVGGACAGFLGYKLIKHERKQANQISQLTGQIEYLDAKLTQTTDYYDFETDYQKDTFNYFAIGNSLTLITSWGRGICSTQPDNDYFHLVINSLEEQYGKVVAYPYNFSPWEKLANRDQAFSLIDPYLSIDLNLITIQLGENVSNISNYEEDLESLINYVKQKAPKATIVVIGDWWSAEKNELRKTAAKNTGVLFADLSNVMGKKEYQSETGLICYLSDGTTIEVSEAASTHPGDLGMQYIAEQVKKALELE